MPGAAATACLAQGLVPKQRYLLLCQILQGKLYQCSASIFCVCTCIAEKVELATWLGASVHG